MNEQTTKLIESLAQKLGTTVEYLWSVLIKQAPISAITDSFYLIITIISGILLYKLHRYFSKETENKRSIYWEEEGAVIAPMVIGVIIWAIFFIYCFFSIGNIINGFLNPEYWALKEILDKV